MNERRRGQLLIGVALGAALVGGFIGRALAPSAQREAQAGRRPIFQIVRQQGGPPSFADAIQGVCPSVAAIALSGPAQKFAPAIAVSSDGWIMAATSTLPSGTVTARIGSGDSLTVSEIRSDPVSDLSILKTGATGLQPARLLDQGFPRVGDFAFAAQNPAGEGCSAETAMVASDFLADGDAPQAYVRLNAMGPQLQPGTPVFSGGGDVIGIAGSASPANSLISAPLVAGVLDELLRNDLSPTTQFGFRAVDFSGGLAARLGSGPSRGAGIALVQPKSGATSSGLLAGDIVVGVNGSPVASASELGRALDAAGKSASLDIVRGGQRLTVMVTRTAGA